MISILPFPIPLCFLIAGAFLVPAEVTAQGLVSGGTSERVARSESEPSILPSDLTNDYFTALKEHSPFLRTLDVSKSLILTGIARIDEEPVAAFLDLETGKRFVVSKNEINPEGWQLVEVLGNPTDIETLTAKIKIAGGSGIFSIRYEKSPPPMKGGPAVMVSNRIGNGSSGGGTGPHGGPDPRILTPDQMKDARNAAHNIREGFQADGYGDKETIPPEVVSKISRLSVDQRESINVKMYEYRNRGLGMPERQKIYNKMLDQTLERR
ncbi:MAG: hypothetical protein KA250_18445 [Verrucomicrobiales bacterium]|nr:hypothetical protein [Verrucomicrobiales bacterium]